MLRLLRLPLQEFRLHTEAAGSAPPDAFGPFRVLHQIGAGALGPVFRAYEPDRDRLVAVKLFRLDLPPERVHQLVSEFEQLIAAGLQHPVLAVPRATGIDGVCAYLAQDFAAADSLDIVIRENGPAPVAEALRVAGQLAAALDYAADLGVLHGSLHPRDILLSQDDIRIAGIGVTPALERAGVAAPVRLPYTAPERIGGGAWDRRADVFSLAATVYELLCGRRVAGTGDDAAVSLTDVQGADPQALRSVFARALAAAPADRFATAGAFAEALKAATETMAPADVVEPAPAPKPKRASRAGLRVVAPKAPPALPLLEEVEEVPEVLAVPEVEPPSPEPASPEPRVVFMPPPAAASSSASVWPIAVAAVIGIALGFGAGYTVAIRDKAGVPQATAVVAPPAAAPEQATPAATDIAEKTVTPPVAEKPAAEKPAPPAFTGRILVRSTPSGARVVVDGKDRGQTPATIRELTRGEHRVRIVRDGYTTAERRVLLSPSQPAQSLSVPLAREPRGQRQPPQAAKDGAAAAAAVAVGTLVVESRPQGATVLIDGRPLGTTPVTLGDVRVGNHAVRLERDGYRIWNAPVTVAAGAENRVTASLEK